MLPPIEPAEYKIISARGDRVIALEKGFPRGNLVVEEPDKLALHQKWAVVYQSDEIYTFKSLVGESKGSKKPYAQNSAVESERENEDPYIRGGALGVLATYKIRPTMSQDPNDKHNWFTIGLPERDPVKVWTIVDNGTNIILDEYKPSQKDQQIWRFEKIDNLKV